MPNSQPMPATIDRHAADLQHLLVHRLSAGGFVAVAHEWLPDGVEMPTWATTVAGQCAAEQVLVEHATDLRTNVTVFMNTVAMPLLGEIEAAIEAIQKDRAAHNGSAA